MAKKYNWNIEETIILTKEEIETMDEPCKDGKKVVNHSVSLVCSNLSGKAIITIDSDEYDISVRPLSLAGTNQMFRLGEMAAVIDFPKKGPPAIVIDGERILPN